MSVINIYTSRITPNDFVIVSIYADDMMILDSDETINSPRG